MQCHTFKQFCQKYLRCMLIDSIGYRVRYYHFFRAFLNAVWNLNEYLKNLSCHRHLLFSHLFSYLCNDSKWSNINNKIKIKTPTHISLSRVFYHQRHEEYKVKARAQSRIYSLRGPCSIHFRSVDSERNVLSFVNTCFKF